MGALIYPLIYYCIIIVVLIVSFAIFIKRNKKKDAIILLSVLIVAVSIFVIAYFDIIQDIVCQEVIIIQGEYTDRREQAPYGDTIIIDGTLKLYSTSNVTKNKVQGQTYIIEYYKNSRIIRSMELLD